MQFSSRHADQTFLMGIESEAVGIEALGHRAQQGIPSPLEIVVSHFQPTNKLVARPNQLNDDEPENDLPADDEVCLEADLTVDMTSDRLLHQFCERRKILQLLNAVQALCVSALAAVTDGNISF